MEMVPTEGPGCSGKDGSLSCGKDGSFSCDRSWRAWQEQSEFWPTYSRWEVHRWFVKRARWQLRALKSKPKLRVNRCSETKFRSRRHVQ